MRRIDEKEIFRRTELLSKIEPAQESIDRAITRVRNVLAGQEHKSEMTSVWRKIMKSRYAKLAAAAVIIAGAVMVGQHGLNGSAAWADVIRALDEVSDAHISGTLHYGEDKESRTDFWYSKPYFLREEWTEVENGKEVKMITVDDGTDRLTVDGEKGTAQLSDSFREWEPISENYMLESLYIFREGGAEHYEIELDKGQSRSGVLIYNIRSKRVTPAMHGRAEVDGGTLLPLKIEMNVIDGAGPDGCSGGVLTFEYGPIDRSLFNTTIPAGYAELPRKQRGTFSGRVLDDMGRPVVKANVYVAPSFPRVSLNCVTDDEGIFSVELPANQETVLWPILVRAEQPQSPDKAAWTMIYGPEGEGTGNFARLDPPGNPGIPILAKPGGGISECSGASAIELVMEKGGQISGVVTDADGSPLPGSEVAVDIVWLSKDRRYFNSIKNFGGASISKYQYSVKANENGGFLMGSLPDFNGAAKYRLHATATGYVWNSRDVTVDGRYAQEADFVLWQSGAKVNVRVVQSNGKALAGYKVLCKPNSGSGLTDRKGRVKFEECALTKELRVVVEASRVPDYSNFRNKGKPYVYYLDKEVLVGYETGKTDYSVEIVMEEPDIKAEFAVKTSDGRPLAGWQVEIRGDGISSEWRRNMRKRTDEDGKCTIERVPRANRLRTWVCYEDEPSDEDKKYRPDEVPIEFIEGKSKYRFSVTLPTLEEYKNGLKRTEVQAE